MKIHSPISGISKCLATAFAACLAISSHGAPVTTRPFGVTSEGEKVSLYTLSNNKGVSVSIATYGAAVVKLITPGRNGKPADIALGFDSVEPYQSKAFLKLNPYFGATIGRYGNRIGNGKFTLDGVPYQLSQNDGPHSLHGGMKGFDKRVWRAEIVKSKAPSVRFSIHSNDGDQGYPGNLDATVTYTLTDKNELMMDFTAVSDKKTVINMTNHTYYNLAGEGNGTILDHEIMIPADYVTAVDDLLIPTGKLEKVEGTPLDFRKATAVGTRIDKVWAKAEGYDHNYVLRKSMRPGLKLDAEVYEPKSGRVLRIYSDQPGVQFYTGNFLDGKLIGKGGKAYLPHGAFCLEPQHFPDSPNHPNFPSTVLEPGHSYHAEIVAAFGVK